MNDRFDELFADRPADADDDRDALREVWNALEELPAAEPPPAMTDNFERALAAYRSALSAAPSPRWWPLAAAAVIALLVGGGVGYVWRAGGEGMRLSQVESEIAVLRRAQSLTLLTHASAPRRLRGVRLGAAMDPDDELLEALLARLVADDNVTVRLAAAEAVAPLAGRPEIQDHLLRVLESDPSPIVQAAVLSLLIEMRASVLRTQLDRLLARDSLHADVRTLALRGKEILQ